LPTAAAAATAGPRIITTTLTTVDRTLTVEDGTAGVTAQAVATARAVATAGLVTGVAAVMVVAAAMEEAEEIEVMIVALASPRVASTLDDGLEKIKRLMSEASAGGAEIVCFPEAYLPGLRGQDFEVLPFDPAQQERALQAVAHWARTYAVATILGMERLTAAGRQIVAYVVDARGRFRDTQQKCRDPSRPRGCGRRLPGAGDRPCPSGAWRLPTLRPVGA
jgi:hypothetical protein